MAELLTSAVHSRSTGSDAASDGWEAKKRAHDRHVRDGHLANDKGSSVGASEAFQRACTEFPRVATLISCVNMRLKCGEAHAGWCAPACLALSRVRK